MSRLGMNEEHLLIIHVDWDSIVCDEENRIILKIVDKIQEIIK